MSKLKPCPFCGKSVAIVISDAEMGYDNNGQYQVICPFYENEDYGCGSSSGWEDSVEEAIECWNRRGRMSRYIDACKFAEKAYDVAYPIVYDSNSHERGLSLMGIAQLLDEQPEVDLVEVVRCKDCDNWEYMGNLGLKRRGSCAEWSDAEDGMTRYTDENDYCSYGERKNG